MPPSIRNTPSPSPDGEKASVHSDNYHSSDSEKKTSAGTKRNADAAGLGDGKPDRSTKDVSVAEPQYAPDSMAYSEVASLRAKLNHITHMRMQEQKRADAAEKELSEVKEEMKNVKQGKHTCKDSKEAIDDNTDDEPPRGPTRRTSSQSQTGSDKKISAATETGGKQSARTKKGTAVRKRSSASPATTAAAATKVKKTTKRKPAAPKVEEKRYGRYNRQCDHPIKMRAGPVTKDVEGMKNLIDITSVYDVIEPAFPSARRPIEGLQTTPPARSAPAELLETPSSSGQDTPTACAAAASIAAPVASEPRRPVKKTKLRDFLMTNKQPSSNLNQVKSRKVAAAQASLQDALSQSPSKVDAGAAHQSTTEIVAPNGSPVPAAPKPMVCSDGTVLYPIGNSDYYW